MEFYESISANYDYIFPANPAHEAFVNKFVQAEERTLRLLDVGCATGSLAMNLAENNAEVWAFDFDAEMVKLAAKKKQIAGLTEFPVFEQNDMRLIAMHYPARHFDAVLCFGNTLVHLLNDADILQFLKAAHAVLHEGGKLLMQILNYDHILSEKISSLPLIENEHIRFGRFYEYPESSGLVDFKTVLTVKSSGEQVSNCVSLNPIRKQKLETLLIESGFREIEFFGNFKGEPLMSSSLPLIAKALK